MNTTAVQWVLDPAHSELTFKVKHLMITNVKGMFRNFDARLESYGPDFGQARVSAVIDAASIDTRNADRDTHLKGADFFDVAHYGQITFQSTGLDKLDEVNYQLKGLLSMKGINKEVVLDVVFGGYVKDPYGNEKAGFSITGQFNRKDWGLNWNAALEAGGVMVSNEVSLQGELQLVKQVNQASGEQVKI